MYGSMRLYLCQVLRVRKDVTCILKHLQRGKTCHVERKRNLIHIAGVGSPPHSL